MKADASVGRLSRGACGALLPVAAVAVWFIAPVSRAQAPVIPPSGSFERIVQPILLDTCAECHAEPSPNAGLNIIPFTRPDSIVTERHGWERIIERLLEGEMPPTFAPPVPAVRWADRSKSAALPTP